MLRECTKTIERKEKPMVRVKGMQKGQCVICSKAEQDCYDVEFDDKRIGGLLCERDFRRIVKARSQNGKAVQKTA